MTIYGSDYYGAPSSFYGEQLQINYSAAPFLAKSWYANIVELVWALPTGAWTRLRLVRSANGAPVHEEDGAVLFDVACGPNANAPDLSFTYWADRDVPGDRWYTYALFVYAIAVTATDAVDHVIQDSFGTDAIDDWVFAGYADVMVVDDHHNTTRMSNLLPTIFTTNPREGGAGQADADADMPRFLSLFGYQADIVRGTYETLLHLHNPDLVPPRVLPLLCAEFGVPYEPQLGLVNTRVLLRNAVRIAKTKGTKVGIENFASSLTGWACNVEQGYNLMLDYNDSSAEETIGRWYPSLNCTVARVPVNTVTPYAGTTGQMAKGSFAITAIAAGLCEMRCGDQQAHSAVGAGVPVVAGLTYTISCYVQAAAVAAPAAIGIAWYDSTGLPLTTGIGATTTTATTGWQPTSFSMVAPINALFAAPVFQVTAGAAEQVQYADAVQFQAGAVLTSFQEARQLQLELASDRTNEVGNPSFEIDTQQWVATAAGGAAAATSITRIAGDHADIAGSACAEVVTSGSVINEGASTVITGLVPNQDYTFSAWVKAISGRPVILRAQPGSGTIISTASANVGAGWTRLFLVVTTGLSDTVTLSVTTDSVSAAASVFRTDAVMLERSLLLRDYFDASTVGVRPSDYRWGGTPHASRSHLYRDFVVKSLRLSELLPDYLWPGMTFNLVVGDVITGTNSIGFGSNLFGSGPFGGSTTGPDINYGDGDYGVGNYE